MVKDYSGLNCIPFLFLSKECDKTRYGRSSKAETKSIYIVTSFCIQIPQITSVYYAFQWLTYINEFSISQI